VPSLTSFTSFPPLRSWFHVVGLVSRGAAFSSHWFSFVSLCSLVLLGFCASSVVVSVEFCHLMCEPFSVAVNDWFDIPYRFSLQEVSNFVKFIKNS